VDLEARVLRAEVALVYSEARTGFAVSLVNGAAIGALLWDAVARPLLVGWLGLLVVVSAARAMLVSAHGKAEARGEVDSALWRTRFVVSSFAGGVVWGVLGTVVFPPASLPLDLAIGFVLAGLAAGAVSYFSAVPAAYYAFAVTGLLPYAARLLALGGFVPIACGGLTLLFLVALAANARRVHRVISESFRARFANEDLARRLRIEVEERAKAEERRAAERRVIDQMKSEFIATVSHELRTPLTSIQGSIDLLAGGVAGTLPEMAADLVGTASANAKRLRLLVDDLLDFEKLSAGRMTLLRRRVPLGPIVDGAVSGAAPFARQFNVRIDRVGDRTADPVADTDPDRLGQVLMNLLSNAVKFSKEGGAVEVSLGVEGARAVIMVQDHGIGIPESFHARMFQKFSQVDSSDTRARGGTGLGLSISKAIVDQLEGEIGFESKVDEGTTFWVKLPTG
jgi:signal transduction histidine kinase